MPRLASTIFASLVVLSHAEADDGLTFFENKIRPVLVEHCYGCHSAEAKKVKGALKLDTKEDFLKGGTDGVVIVAGEPEKSSLIAAVRYGDKDLQMPPNKDGGKKLPDAAIADLTQWVKMGAPYPDTPAAVLAKKKAPRLWSLDPVKNPAAPSVKDAAWPRTSIDPFILARIDAAGLKPAADAEPRTFIRRATFDLTGLPPTPEEVETFVADSTRNSQSAIRNLIDRLLASPHYGERWGRHWLDVVRYADTAGETADYPVPLAWRYRNYVIDAFNADKPYDQFLREQIAGDVIALHGPREQYAERATATGYLAISRRFGFDSENYHNLTIQDTIDTLGQSVLGLSLGCARCHDHKFDPVTTSDYYALYGIFDSTRYAFPGSEQKQKARAMLPLLPPEEARPQWREYDARVAALAGKLEKAKQPVPSAVLRSLDDFDGDFEMQAAAAGGSNGVLVPPWIYEGKIAVTNAAQSPFKNLYPSGKVGVNVSVGTDAYRVAQGLHPRRTRENCRTFFVNLDFRVAAPNAVAPGAHRFWIGARGDSPAVEVLISSESVSLRSGEKIEIVAPLKPGHWHNLQLALDLEKRTVSGSVSAPGEVTGFADKAFSPKWTGTLDFAALDSPAPTHTALPVLDLDNFGAQDTPIPPISTATPSIDAPDFTALSAELQKLVGIDGDFEIQKDGAPPATPWGPGPNSLVQISANAQSPFRNVCAPGTLGIHLPNRAEYDGFGQTLASVKPDQDGRLFVGFDFRGASADAGGDGSWRYYIGHGPGVSAAVELFFNGKEFFRRSADARDSVCALKIGEWYQVQLALDLKAKTYTGRIASVSGRTEFGGQLASGWDGTIDYTFIDSYGHRPGVRPALDADNFVIRDAPLPPLDSAPVAITETSRNSKVAEIRRQVTAMQADLEKSKQELETLLVNGPGEMTYGMVEGTPHNARVQVRGEMDRPGEETPRGFIKVLGGASLPPETEGSGRLELAQWLTRSDNPLTARVMVNRLWQYHFGRGLVKTPNDFGVRGQPPTHPELLDHLATEFMKSGWSVKAMHRLIMLSATYQQAASADGAEVFAGFTRRRLSAEELRDSILAISGELDPTPGREHPFPSPLSWGYSQHGPFAAVYDSNKRSVYLMVQRIKRHPFLALFDGADPNTSTPDRRATTVPTQALYFLNDPFVHTKAEKFAARLQAARPDESQRIDLANRLTLGRAPNENERAEAAEFLAAYRAEIAATGKGNAETVALAAYVRTLFGENEFLHLD